jgi:spermidine synthase
MIFAACLLAFFTGFLSLSQEILWVRLFSFANHSLPQSFAFVLMVYLLGIAIGARIGKWMCGLSVNLWELSGCVLMFASFFDLVSPWFYASFVQTSFQLTLGGMLIFITAALKAVIFPIAHHLGVPSVSEKVGISISRVYVSNIMGATLGPIITGMFLLDVLSTQACFAACAGMTFCVGLFCLRSSFQRVTVLMMGSAFAVVFVSFTLLHSSMQLMGIVADLNEDIRRIVENRHGIVTTYNEKWGGDLVFGGNVYDGRTNLDPLVNSNGINRLLILSTLQDRPERVLMIGLSIGTWLKLITSFPGVKQIDVVEINPGYLEAIKDYPQQASALTDPRVKLYIDDGRRWLRTHPDRHYDLVVINTTWYWRAYSSNLLSREFLLLLKQHMNAGALLAYNTTGSPDVMKTANAVFSHIGLYGNFVIAADYNWLPRLSDREAINKLSALRLDGKPLIPIHELSEFFVKEPVLSFKFIEAAYKAQHARKLEVITDLNLITEYKYGRRLGT